MTGVLHGKEGSQDRAQNSPCWCSPAVKINGLRLERKVSVKVICKVNILDADDKRMMGKSQ